MKPRVYLIIFLLLIPLQGSLFEPISLAGVKPDLGLALIYIIGLLTGPAEAALAGLGIGLLQDIGSASIIGFSGITRGLVGLFAGLLGQRVLNISSPSNSLFLAVFSLLEGIAVMLFLQLLYGSVPLFSLIAGRVLPQAVYTGLLGVLLLQLTNSREFLASLTRRGLQKEF